MFPLKHTYLYKIIKKEQTTEGQNWCAQHALSDWKMFLRLLSCLYTFMIFVNTLPYRSFLCSFLVILMTHTVRLQIPPSFFNSL